MDALVLTGDSLTVLRDLPENSVDSIITDPPYGLAFMGKKWDYDVPSKELWAEVLRVLKPGGHLLSFGGTRTYHRMVVAIEDAGFEIRDQVMWIYGSGFPKSLDVSKAIDKAAGAEREVIGMSHIGGGGASNSQGYKDGSGGSMQQSSDGKSGIAITAPATDAAKQWQGFGTALKPANEPIVLARKPLSEKTVAANVLKWGTGAINVDASRIVPEDKSDDLFRSRQGGFAAESEIYSNDPKFKIQTTPAQGRWPANVLFDEEAAAVLDEQSGDRPSRGTYLNKTERYKVDGVTWKHGGNVENTYANEKGGASRFFYVAKASKRERGEGNIHPTVKPIKLMEYLCKLITPPGGIILDPFCGSGTTGVAAQNLKFSFIGIERELEYVAIAEKRLISNNKAKVS